MTHVRDGERPPEDRYRGQATLHGSQSFRITMGDHGVATLWFDAPGLANLLGARLPEELDVAVDVLAGHPEIRGVILASGKADHFCHGADLHEIISFADADHALRVASAGQRVFERLARLSYPVVAAIHGACLGGGLELALTASRRVVSAHPSTQLGLPEVKLGLVPGLGGTQRLPRLIGLRAALDLILSGEPVTAARACELGLASEVVAPERLLERAATLVIELVRGTAPAPAPREPDKPEKARTLFAAIEKSLRLRYRGHYPAPPKAVEVVRLSQGDDVTAGFAAEARAFADLAESPEAHHLIQLFLTQDFLGRSAERTVARHCPSPPRVLGLVGTGVMAVEIARLALRLVPGIEVRVKASTAARAAAFRSSFDPAARLVAAAEASVLADTDLVIEAIVEDQARKRQVLAEVEAQVRESTVIATNTSAIALDHLGRELRRPERFLGLHFFAPIDRMQLVEVVTHPTTTTPATAAALAFVTALGKTPLPVRDSTGFLVNRLLCTHLLEAGRLLVDGVPLAWVEEAAVAFGMPMGPFTLLDELGLPLCFSVARELHAAFGERFAPPPMMDRTQAAGLSGKQAGRGVFLWSPDGRKLGVNPEFLALHGFEQREDKPEGEALTDLQDRLLLPMVDEAARCVDEKVVRRARELDAAMVIGAGFPAFRGGPLAYADARGVSATAAAIEAVYARAPAGARRSLSPLFTSLRSTPRGFYGPGGE